MDLLSLLQTGFEGYPPEYVAHNAPFIVLSGLESADDSHRAYIPQQYRDGAIKIHSDVPVIAPDRAKELVAAFRAFERKDDQWDANPVAEGTELMGFRFKVIGRSYEIFPRKAKPPTQDVGYELPGSPGTTSPPHWILHSPLSPLTPGSPLFPDGVVTPQWLAKHQSYVPAAFMTFFQLSVDPSRNSLLDNQLKTEINNIKATLNRSDYKTKLVVVLVSDQSGSDIPDLEDRLNNIRRATGLDTRTSFFFLPSTNSSLELQAFASGVLSALQPGCVEHYRDLTKHAKRKRSRGNIPAPTAPPTRGTSQTLASLGWGIRYDFKLGVFAEFRQEMETACRSYTSALEALLGPDGIFESTASWSPRWEEARLLADMVAMRILRCLLWGDLTTTAVQSWLNYRLRLKEIVDRRGKGSANYGWEAWESRWSRMMAELVRRSQLDVFKPNSNDGLSIYAPVEKIIPVGERIQPFEHLHHPGYWLRVAAKHGRRRRRFAQELPEEDCMPPGQSPASAMASRYGTYDAYLCPEPWQERPANDHKTYNHSKDVFSALERAEKHFDKQARMQSELQLDMSREYMRNKQFAEATPLLHRLWRNMAWRHDRWWDLVLEVTSRLWECAKQIGDGKLLAAAEFELHHRSLPVVRNHNFDLARCNTGVPGSSDYFLEESIQLDDGFIKSFLVPSFVFLPAEGNAGEALRSQLIVTSEAQGESAPVTADTIEIKLHGSPYSVALYHSSSMATSRWQEAILNDGPDVMSGQANLELQPGETRVWELPLIFRETGDVSLESVVFTISTATAPIIYTATPSSPDVQAHSFKLGPKSLIATKIHREAPSSVHIRPRPPRMEIKLSNANDHFYTDEEIELKIDLLNNEDEATEVSLQTRLLTDDGPYPYQWKDESNPPSGPEDSLGHSVGKMDSATFATAAIIFTAPTLPTHFILEVKVLYHLVSDPSTPVSKIANADINVTRAFEANYDFQPRMHPDPWPSFFSATDRGGLKQQWELAARIASFTYEGVLISSIRLEQEHPSSHANVIFNLVEPLEEDLEIAPQQQIEKSFLVEVSKRSIEDRRGIELELVLAIEWHRPHSASGRTFTSLLPVNSFVLENGPRVLASISYPGLPLASNVEEDGDGAATSDLEDIVPVAQLTFTLENPTNHLLSFELTMEGPQKEDWALSGMKIRSLSLLPLSRESVTYRLMPLSFDTSERKWLEVRFRVMDVYFRKVLRCIPASRGVREAEGKAGNLLVWV